MDQGRHARRAAKSVGGIARVDARRVRHHALRARRERAARRSSISTAVAGLLGSLTLVASGIGGILFGADRRPLRSPSRADRKHARLLGIHGRVRICAVHRGSSACSVSCSGWAWAANGRAAPRWFPRRGPTGIGARPLRSCRARGPSAMPRRLSSSRWCFHGSAGASCSCWHPAGAADAVDSSRRGGVGGLAAVAGASRSPHARRSTMCFAAASPATTALLTLLSTSTIFAYWGLNLWVPAYLSLDPARGGLGLSTPLTTLLVVTMQVGTFFGYVSFGYVSDAVGRRKSVRHLHPDRRALTLLYGVTTNPWMLLVLGPRRRVLRDRLLLGIRRGDGGDLSDVDSSGRPGIHVQRRPPGKRRRAVSGRVDGADAGIRRRVLDAGWRAADRRRDLDLASRNSRAQRHVTRGSRESALAGRQLAPMRQIGSWLKALGSRRARPKIAVRGQDAPFTLCEMLSTQLRGDSSRQAQSREP